MGNAQQSMPNVQNEKQKGLTVLCESDDLQHPADFGKDLFHSLIKKEKKNKQKLTNTECNKIQK